MLISLFALSIGYAYAQMNMGSVTMGCVVTKNMLFSQGNYIRNLQTQEMEQLSKYRKELGAFQRKIEEAFDNAEEREATNSTVPPMPTRPILPSFCTAPDTIMYIFGSCTIQNNRVYVGKNYARDLDEKEKAKMKEFQAKMAERQKVGKPATPDLHKGLRFCIDL